MKWIRIVPCLWIGPLTLPCPASSAEPSSATEWARCATIAAAAARLSCYDELARSAPKATAPPAPVTTAPGPAAAPGVPNAHASSDLPENFGLSNAQLGAAGLRDEGVQSIQARISELPGDQLRAGYAVLDNGQTWKCTDGDMILRVGEAVTIRRAALGSYMLVSESRHTYHVRRLR